MTTEDRQLPATEGKRELPRGAPMTLKQEAFCLEYVRNGGNASQAYRFAYDSTTMVEGTVNQAASRLLDNPKVAARIADHRDFSARSAGIQEARVIAEVANIALSDPYELFDEDNNLRQIRDMPRHVRASIASIEIETRMEGKGEDRTPVTRHKVKLWPKTDAANMLMKHLGSYEKDNRQRAGALDGLSRETLLLMKERLLALRQARKPALIESEPSTAAE